MFFKHYFNGIAEIFESKLKSYERVGQNPADKGELCEVFVKEFLVDSLSDNFKIFRGGKVVNSEGLESSQIDIVLCSKRTIKIFSDKGIYPTETVKGLFSITATLDSSKLDSCMQEFSSVPKTNYHFHIPAVYPEKFRIETQRVFENITPFNCVFAYRGTITEKTIEHINNWISNHKPNVSLIPDIIAVNNIGMILKLWEKIGDNKFRVSFRFVDFKLTNNPGECFSRILYGLYNLSQEDIYLQPEYSEYFNKDL